MSGSIFLPLFCPTPRVALLVVDLSPSQSLPLWFAQHLGVDLLVVDLSRQLRQSVSTFQSLKYAAEVVAKSKTIVLAVNVTYPLLIAWRDLMMKSPILFSSGSNQVISLFEGETASVKVYIYMYSENCQVRDELEQWEKSCVDLQ